MLGDLIIDGVDVYAKFGVIVQEGGYKALLNYPALKPFDTVNWPDEDGVEVDLSEPRLDTRTTSIGFAAHGANVDNAGFIAFLCGSGEYGGSAGTYHIFDFREIGTTKVLRMHTQPNLEVFGALRFFTLEFADDFPLIVFDLATGDAAEYQYSEPINSIGAPTSGYELDGLDMSRYRLRVLGGTAAEIEKSPAVKKNLAMPVSGHGVVYDDAQVVFETKDVKLNCFMRTNTVEEFWRNYYALLFDLVRPNERQFYADAMGEEYPCYYKSCQTQELNMAGGRVWWKFALTLCFTSFRASETEVVFASEEGEWIITEDGFAIDLKEEK